MFFPPDRFNIREIFVVSDKVIQWVDNYTPA